MSAQTIEFKAEVKELLHLMIHSLYSHKEVFLRELISNASDAIDKVRYLSLTDNTILEGDSEWKIKIAADKEAGTLTIRDNGIGMNEEDLILALGTIAHSGTKEFLRLLSAKEITEHPELIGQFGVGFYSAFMVADRIVVISRKAGDPKDRAVRWESRAEGSFEVESFEKERRGTDVILYLKDEEKKYLDEGELRSIVRKYSDYIDHPIAMDIMKDGHTEEEVLNSRKAIWLKDKSEVTAGEYNEFYAHVSHDWNPPAKVVHIRAEGTSEFSALLFIPSKAPFDLFFKEYKIGPMLYVRRVQIMDHCEALLPVYLRFVKGVVESSDLPLNVSREMLQSNRQIEIIRKNITKKVLDLLTEMKNKDTAAYTAWHAEFRKSLKEGLYLDPERRETLADLVLFESTHTPPGVPTSLSEYVERMKPDQEFLYTMAGSVRSELERSPYLEGIRDRGFEVLFFVDEIDEFVMTDLVYRNKKFKSVTKGDIEIAGQDTPEKKDAIKKYGKVLDRIKDHLKDDVKDVRFSSRLTDSPCCLVADEGDLDQNMERIMKAMGQEVPARRRILELNPVHPLVASLNALFEADKDQELLKDFARLLFEQALILEGSRPKDPAALTRLISRLMIDHSQHTVPPK